MNNWSGIKEVNYKQLLAFPFKVNIKIQTHKLSGFEVSVLTLHDCYLLLCHD